MRSFTPHHSSSGNRFGIAALPLVLLMGAMITEIAVGLMIGNFLLNQSESGLRASSVAFLAAQSGYEDALLRVIRDKEYEGSYTLAFSDSTADITVCTDAPEPACAGSAKTRITVLGKSQNANRNFQMILHVDQTTGEATLESFAEVAL